MILLALVGLTSGLGQAQDWTLNAQQYLYRDPIVFSETTRYQHIVLTRSRAGDISCFINGHLQFNSFDEHIYHENLVHPAFAVAPQHKQVLVLGGGDGLAVREILKYPDVETVTVCDIDPMMTQLARENPYLVEMNQNSFKDSRVTTIRNHALVEVGKEEIVIPNHNLLFRGKPKEVAEVYLVHLDAAVFVKQISGVFDIIIIDLPDPNSLELAKLYSLEFYVEVAKKLAANGILVQQSTSPVHAKEAFLCIGRTMQAAGLTAVPYHDNVPSFGEWGWWITCKPGWLDAAELKASLHSIQSIPVPVKYLTAELVRASVEFGKNQLDARNFEVSTQMNNRIYEYYLEAWKRGV